MAAKRCGICISSAGRQEHGVASRLKAHWFIIWPEPGSDENPFSARIEALRNRKKACDLIGHCECGLLAGGLACGLPSLLFLKGQQARGGAMRFWLRERKGENIMKQYYKMKVAAVTGNCLCVR